MSRTRFSQVPIGMPNAGLVVAVFTAADSVFVWCKSHL
jgi:hypothetical protein